MLCHHASSQSYVSYLIGRVNVCRIHQYNDAGLTVHCSCVAGTGISLAGVFIYSQVKRMSGKKKLA